MVIEMPRPDFNYFDPSVEAIEDSKMDNQIDILFKEYEN